MFIALALSSAHADTLALRDVTADACGTVTGTLDVLPAFFARTMTVESGSASVEVAVPAFTSDVPFTVERGRAGPVEVGASWWFVSATVVSVPLPPLQVRLDTRVPEEVWAGTAFEVPVTVRSACPTLAPEVRLVTAAGDTLASVEAAAGPQVLTATLPREGTVSVKLEASLGSVILAQTERHLVVGPPCVDRDGDGHLACRHDDCDDAAPGVFPGQTEVLGNGLDDDCDGVNGQDADRDGYEAAAVGGTDCDDRVAFVHPGASVYPDADRDGAVAFAVALDLDCDGVREEVPKYDCADTDPRIPRAEEGVPTGVDEDCDGLVDEGTVVFDDDGDGLAEVAGDCNDADPSVRPGARETPDCRDEDCDGVIDDGVTRRHQDDRFEVEGGAYELPGATWKRGFFGGHWRGSSTRVSAVIRDRGDTERYTVDARDGTFDDFHVSVAVTRMGDGQVYEVTVSGPGGTTTETVDAPGSVGVGGSAGSDDSGTYDITITPVGGELDWCPLELTVSTG
jgi:hypothetical protein